MMNILKEILLFLGGFFNVSVLLMLVLLLFIVRSARKKNKNKNGYLEKETGKK